MMIKNVKIQVTPEQTVKIQKVVFDNDGRWVNKTKTINWLIITADGDISWATTDTAKCYSEFDAEEWLKNALGSFPIYKMQQDGKFIVGFDGETSGQVVWVRSGSDITFEVGDYSENWNKFTNPAWKDVDIDLFFNTVENNIEDHVDELEYEESVKTSEDILQGTIVQATRKGSTSDKDYTWQGAYFGYCNGKHLIDANTTHAMLADEIEVIPTLTKKEAKQKISELFANPKNVTSEKVRNIIDLIKN